MWFFILHSYGIICIYEILYSRAYSIVYIKINQTFEIHHLATIRENRSLEIRIILKLHCTEFILNDRFDLKIVN